MIRANLPLNRSSARRAAAGRRASLQSDALGVAAIRFVLLFALLFLTFETIYHLAVLPCPTDNVYNRASARVAAGVLHVLGRAPDRHGTVLSVDGGPPIHVQWGCDGLEPIGLLLAGVFAFPLPVRRRLAGAAAAILVLLILNVVRLAILALASAHAPGWFQLLHLELLPGLLILASILLWLWLIAGIGGGGVRGNA